MSLVIKEEEDENKQCRICLDNDNPEELISPCLCNGTLSFVHRKCLNSWRSQNANGKGFKFCDICKFEYVIENIINDKQEERKRLIKYYLFVIRDLILINLLIQIIIILIAFLFKYFDQNSNFLKDLFPNFLNGFSIYYISSLIFLLSLLGLIAFIICCYAIGVNLTNGTFPCRWSTGIGIIVLIFAFIGIIVGIIISFIIFNQIIKHHTSKLWLRQEAEKYFVKDFYGKRNQIENYQNHFQV